LGWTDPTANPPGDNVPPPINVGDTDQTKDAGLTLNDNDDEILTLIRQGGTNPTYFKIGQDDTLVIRNTGSDVLTLKGGNVGIGTTSPSAKLEVAGDLEIDNLENRDGSNFFDSCAAGSSIRQINSNGSVVCEIDDPGGVASDNTILNTCQICVRYADADGRASASWRCANIESSVNTDFVGDVNADDDFDLRISCGDSSVQNSYRLCRRYADSNLRRHTHWGCVDFGQDLLTDFVGNVNSDDDFDLVITPETPGEILTSCGICVRYADADGRASAPWRCSTIGNPVITDFTGGVNSDDDFDLKLSCQILFDDGH